MSKKIIAVVPAAGIGSRMKSDLPKQYLKINDKTILEHTLAALLSFNMIEKVYVVLHPQDNYFSTLELDQNKKLSTVMGGSERVDSVLAGLKQAYTDFSDSWVLVHDAARPMIRQSDIERLIKIGQKYGSAVLATPCVDTLKQATSVFDTKNDIHKISSTIDRRVMWQAQTPQFAELGNLIKSIESCPQRQNITDEASALEMAGNKVVLVEGDASNIKITKPSDLALAEFYLSKAH